MKIHYSNPYSTEKNIGKALNEFCAIVPDGDWICLQDGDMMYLTPDWGKQIEEVVKKHGRNYSLIGCMTNRLGRKIQRHNEVFSNDFDIRNHLKIAEELRDKNWSVVEDITKKRKIAGMFMLFPKSLWNKIKFQENCINFDDRFCQDIIKVKGKLGLMKGLYVFHCYRIWSDTPHLYVRHLL